MFLCAYHKDLAPGMLEPDAGTRTAFLSSVRETHWSSKILSRSTASSLLSANRKKFNFNNVSIYYITNQD